MDENYLRNIGISNEKIDQMASETCGGRGFAYQSGESAGLSTGEVTQVKLNSESLTSRPHNKCETPMVKSGDTGLRYIIFIIIIILLNCL